KTVFWARAPRAPKPRSSVNFAKSCDEHDLCEENVFTCDEVIQSLTFSHPALTVERLLDAE
ncbi:MAG: hypothetical protein AAGA75_28560, partial [Cyanobacteria bacterium P01_E01_bin.6]